MPTWSTLAFRIIMSALCPWLVACGRIEFDALGEMDAGTDTGAGMDAVAAADSGSVDAGVPGVLSDPDGDGQPDWVAFYPLDDCGAEDVVAGHAGTVVGAPTPEADRAGVAGGACRFPSDAYVEVPYFGELATPQYSISVWVRPAWAEYTDFGSIYMWRDEGPIAGFTIFVRNLGTDARWLNYMAPDPPNATSNPWTSIGFDTAQDDAWHHVASTYDGTTVTLYLDAVEIGSAPTTYNPAHTRPLRIAMGGTEGGTQYPFAGTVDEVLVYDRALTAAEVAAIHSR